MRDLISGAVALIAVGLVVIAILCGLIWGFQTFKVYSAEMSGKAQLAEAEGNRQIKVLEAQALNDSAQLYADAEVTRAEGISKANTIIGDSLKNNEAYLRYLYIDMLRENEGVQTIYVPTEAGLPILEASRGFAQ